MFPRYQETSRSIRCRRFLYLEWHIYCKKRFVSPQSHPGPQANEVCLPSPGWNNICRQVVEPLNNNNKNNNNNTRYWSIMFYCISVYQGFQKTLATAVVPPSTWLHVDSYCSYQTSSTYHSHPIFHLLAPTWKHKSLLYINFGSLDMHTHF